MCCYKCLQTEQEDDDGNNEQSKDESSHDDDHDAESLACTNECYCEIGVVVIVVNTVHSDGEGNGLGGNLRWTFADVWGQAQNVGFVQVGRWG